jgi:hypothetical protein
MGLSYYKPGYRASRKMKDTDVTLLAATAWSAAAYADRLNGGEYRKEPEYLVLEDGTYTDQVVRQPNKVYMWQAIKDHSVITEEDRHVGRQAQDWVRKNLVIKGLKTTLSDFDRALSSAVEMQEFSTGSDRYEIALITSQIRAWREGTRLEAVLEDVVRVPVAAVGEKVRLNVEVIKSVYSPNYNVYFITAKTDGHQMVFFSYRERRPVGECMTICGTVKAHRPDATQLNRVRVAA